MSSPLSLALYSLSSFTLSVLVVLYAYATRIRFYPMVVFLFTSKFALVSMINSGLVLGFLLSLSCVRLFLGKLREAETEAMWEHLRYTVMESAFALTTFREELTIRIAALFSIMLFTKLFQMLLAGRIEHLEQQSNPNLGKWVHFRLVALVIFLLVLNSSMLAGSVWHIRTFGPSVYLLFAFEHALLLVNLASLAAKYAICLYDLHVVEGRWANKSAIEMYIALACDAVQFALFCAYSYLIWKHCGLPIHILRSVYFTAKTLYDRITHFARYRQILHTLNQRFPDATQEELANTDGVCIICREEMFLDEAENNGLGRPKKLTCNHLFHSYCLQTWLERQFSCPTCRRPIPTGLPVDAHAAYAPAAAAAAAGAQEERAQAEAPQQQEEPRAAAAAAVTTNANQMFDEMEEEFKAAAAAATTTTATGKQVREEEEEEDELLKFSPLFGKVPVSPPHTRAAASAALAHAERRELLELELRVFEAQSAVAKQVYELSKQLTSTRH